MSEPRRKTYRPWAPQHYRQEAHSPEAKLPAGDWVFFVLDAVPKLDLCRFYAPEEDATRGAPPFDPAMRVCLVLYAYCVGVFSSRQLAQACERHLAFIAIVGQERPDFRPLSDVRTRPLEAFPDGFVPVLRVAGEAGMVKRGNVATDGTTIPGNASRHKARSEGSRRKEAARLREDIEALVTPAHPQDAEDDAALGSQRGEELPAELARRADRLAPIAAAMRRLEARAKADADAERQRRAEAEADRPRLGPPRRGKVPKPVEETPDDKAQPNCTDPAWQIMRTHTTGGEYCGNAHVSVEAASQIIVACDVSGAAHDKQPAEPLAPRTVAHREHAGIAPPKDAAGAAQKIPAPYESGYSSAAAAAAVAQLGFDPSRATGRQRHHTPEAESPALVVTAQERMRAQGQTPAGRAVYARRKVIVEPVCGQIKAGRGFRRFLLRGLDNLRGEWCVVCGTHNLLTIWRYACAPLPA